MQHLHDTLDSLEQDLQAYAASRSQRLDGILQKFGEQKAGFNPNQPRVPAGNPDGGQWTDGGSHFIVTDKSEPAKNLSMSPKGLSFIGGQEGFSSTVYKDNAGYPTIGYGHKILPDESFPHSITHQEALVILRQDISVAQSAVQRHVKAPLTQYQFDSLTSFTFNEGGDRLRTSTLLKLLNQGDYSGAADQLLRWNKVYDRQLRKYVVNRRHAERSLFLTGLYP